MIILYILLSFCFVMMIFSGYMLAKNENTHKNRLIIINAIHDYYCYRIDLGEDPFAHVNYSDMEDYDKTLNRLWDWGYENILPPGKFEVIKHFIKE